MALCLNECPNVGDIRDKEQGFQNPIRVPLRALLNFLDRIYSKNPELGDTAVRERMFEVINSRFIRLGASGPMPAQFGLFSSKANQEVGKALEKFLVHPDVVAAAKKLKTPKSRLAAFQDASTTSRDGNTYDEYFGNHDKIRT